MVRGGRFGKYGDFKRKAKIREVGSLRLDGRKSLRTVGCDPVLKRRKKKEDQH